jgi:drug/metabolite transporter (DMT)-like permease
VEIKWPKYLTVKELAVSELIVCSIACLILLPFEKIEVENVNIEWASLCLLLGIMVSIEAVLFFEIQSKRGALFCSVADYIATISGVLFGVILFSETANILMLLSILMVLVSTMIVNQSEPKKHAS